jgi:superfamily I DNA/RNA helicase
VLSAISDAKNQLVHAGEYEALAKDPFARTVSLDLQGPRAGDAQANAVSFDDLLVLPVQILRANRTCSTRTARASTRARRRVPGHEPRAVRVRAPAGR